MADRDTHFDAIKILVLRPAANELTKSKTWGIRLDEGMSWDSFVKDSNWKRAIGKPPRILTHYRVDQTLACDLTNHSPELYQKLESVENSLLWKGGADVDIAIAEACWPNEEDIPHDRKHRWQKAALMITFDGDSAQ